MSRGPRLLRLPGVGTAPIPVVRSPIRHLP